MAQSMTLCKALTKRTKVVAVNAVDNTRWQLANGFPHLATHKLPGPQVEVLLAQGRSWKNNHQKMFNTNNIISNEFWPLVLQLEISGEVLEVYQDNAVQKFCALQNLAKIDYRISQFLTRKFPKVWIATTCTMISENQQNTMNKTS